MIILGIETSCDETAAAVLTNNDKRITILSNVVASSSVLQAKYGGVIPEQAAREQIKSIIPVIEEALLQAFPKSRLPRRFAPRNDKVEIDAIAVTYGPGLIGSLLVGVETAKTLAVVWKKPLIPVNHLLGHFYANWIDYCSSPLREVPYGTSLRSNKNCSSTSSGKIATGGTRQYLPRNDSFSTPSFPCIGLLVSGGHTDLVLFQNHGKYQYLGGTRDDAAGECFDKCARLLGLPYPGGPEIAKLASQVLDPEHSRRRDTLRFKLPRPMIKPSFGWDFSFSGLKTAVANLIHTSEVKKCDYTSEVKCNLAAAIEEAIVDVLVAKTIRAVKEYGVKQIIVAGGVAANQKLVRNLQCTILRLRSGQVYNLQLKTKLHVPPPELCTDNAAMIAASAFYNYHPIDPLTLQAEPNLSLSSAPRVVAM